MCVKTIWNGRNQTVSRGENLISLSISYNRLRPSEIDTEINFTFYSLLLLLQVLLDCRHYIIPGSARDVVPISMVTNLRESFVEENSEEDQVWIKIVVGIDQMIFFFFPKHRNQVSIIGLFSYFTCCARLATELKIQGKQYWKSSLWVRREPQKWTF